MGFYLLIAVILLLTIFALRGGSDARDPVTYGQIRRLLEQQQVSNVVLEDNRVTLTLKEPQDGQYTVTYDVGDLVYRRTGEQAHGLRVEAEHARLVQPGVKKHGKRAENDDRGDGHGRLVRLHTYGRLRAEHCRRAAYSTAYRRKQGYPPVHLEQPADEYSAYYRHRNHYRVYHHGLQTYI